MTHSPLITTALLGTARMSVMPPPPDVSLENTWSELRTQDPAEAILQALALTRALYRGGAKSHTTNESVPSCAPERRNSLSPSAIDALTRLLKGEFAEVLPEWLRLAVASGHVLPGRVFPELLAAANTDHSLRPAVRILGGERGLWIGRRHRQFSWLIEDHLVRENAWDDGEPAERIAWLRQTRAADPTHAREAVISHWSGEDATMRQAIVKVISENPLPEDEPWLQQHALSDRRQEIRELAAGCLACLPDSAFRKRALDRLRNRISIQRRLLRRVVTVQPPDAFDPSWVADGIKEKPPQGTGEKAWWLRQMVSLLPLDEWPALLGCSEADVFNLSVESDWKDALLLGWFDSARRMPARMMAGQVIPYFAKLTPWPPALPRRELALMELLEGVPAALRFELLDILANELDPPVMLDLLARCRQAPPAGTGVASLVVIDAAIPVLFRTMARPQARALALCIPQNGIQQRIEAIAKLSELPSAAEEFATILEFRRSLLIHFNQP